MATHLDFEEQEQIDQIKHFWSKWGTPITGMLVIVMGGLAAWSGWQFWQQRQATQAAILSDAVIVAIQSGDQQRVTQAFNDVKSEYPSTIQAGQSALQVAQAAQKDGNSDAAKAALQWAVDNTKDAGYQATAKLRLAALLIEEKELDAAITLLEGNFPVEFQGLAADRLGDALKLQGQDKEAIAAYQQAWQLLDPALGYRTLVGFKLNALGEPTTLETVK